MEWNYNITVKQVGIKAFVAECPSPYADDNVTHTVQRETKWVAVKTLIAQMREYDNERLMRDGDREYY